MKKTAELAEVWIKLKMKEVKARDKRRVVEDKLSKLLHFKDDIDSRRTHKTDGYIFNVTSRLNRTIDREKLDEIIKEEKLEEHLDTLFRWKPEINLTNWRKTSEDITDKLMPAITVKPGRISYIVTKDTTTPKGK